MRSIATSLLLFILFTPGLFAQVTYNAALGRPVTVIYADPDPTHISSNYSDPAKLVDGIISFSSLFEIVPGNVGTRIIIDLGDTTTVERMVLNSPAKDFRPRAFTTRTSSDTVEWSPWFQVSQNDTNIVDYTASARTFRWFEFSIESMDPFISTAMTEIRLIATATRPMVLTASVSPPPTDTSQYQTINWTTALWDATKTVSISVTTPSGGQLNVVSGILNTGTFRWKTSELPDGVYRVRIAPDTAGIAGVASGSVSNFINRSAFVATPSGSDSIARYPGLAVPFTADTILFRSTAVSRFGRTFSRRLDWSPDSGRTWAPLMNLSTSDSQTVRVPSSLVTRGALYGFLRLAVLSDTTLMAAVVSKYPIQSADIPPGTTLRHTTSKALDPTYGGASPIDLLLYRDGSQQTRIALADGWVVTPTLDTLPHYGTPSGLPGSLAAADVDRDGVVELVSTSGYVARPESGAPPFWSGDLGDRGVTLVDLRGDADLEICEMIDAYGVVVHDSRMNPASIFEIPQIRTASVMDVSGDSRPEVVATIPNGVHVFTGSGQSIPGFPTTFASTTMLWTVPIEADGDPQSEIVSLGSTHLYLVNDSSQVLPGFPLLVDGSVNRPPIVVDLDGDGRQEVVFARRNRFSPGSKLFAVSRTGQHLSGWPRDIPGTYRFPALVESYYNPPTVDLVEFEPVPSLLAASIDGDNSVELFVFGANGMLTIFRADGTIVDGYPALLGNRTYDTPVLGDIDEDGALDLVYRVYQDFPIRHTYVNVEFPPGSYNPDATPWPMFMANAQRTGKANPTIPVGVKDDPASEVPASFSLRPNYPNPFNPSTTIEYTLPRDVQTTVRVTDLLGRVVATLVDGAQTAGLHRVRFDADHLPSGVYIVSVAAGPDRAVQRMLLMK